MTLNPNNTKAMTMVDGQLIAIHAPVLSSQSRKAVDVFIKAYDFYAAARKADKLEALSNLLKKTVPYVWTSEHQKAFEDLKAALTSDTLLEHNLDDGELILRTDASQFGVGGVLLRRKNALTHQSAISATHLLRLSSIGVLTTRRYSP